MTASHQKTVPILQDQLIKEIEEQFPLLGVDIEILHRVDQVLRNQDSKSNLLIYCHRQNIIKNTVVLDENTIQLRFSELNKKIMALAIALHNQSDDIESLKKEVDILAAKAKATEKIKNEIEENLTNTSIYSKYLNYSLEIKKQLYQLAQTMHDFPNEEKVWNHDKQNLMKLLEIARTEENLCIKYSYWVFAPHCQEQITKYATTFANDPQDKEKWLKEYRGIIKILEINNFEKECVHRKRNYEKYLKQNEIAALIEIYLDDFALNPDDRSVWWGSFVSLISALETLKITDSLSSRYAKYLGDPLVKKAIQEYVAAYANDADNEEKRKEEKRKLNIFVEAYHVKREFFHYDPEFMATVEANVQLSQYVQSYLFSDSANGVCKTEYGKLKELQIQFHAKKIQAANGLSVPVDQFRSLALLTIKQKKIAIMIPPDQKIASNHTGIRYSFFKLKCKQKEERRRPKKIWAETVITRDQLPLTNAVPNQVKLSIYQKKSQPTSTFESLTHQLEKVERNFRKELLLLKKSRTMSFSH